MLNCANSFSINDYKKNDKIIYTYFKDKYGKWKASLDFILIKIDETKNSLLKEIKHNDSMSEKHKKVFRALNYFEHFIILVSAVTGCALVSAFPLLVDVPVDIASSTIR